MSSPINKLFYINLIKIKNKSEESFESLCNTQIRIAIAICGLNEEFIVIETLTENPKVFKKKKIGFVIEYLSKSVPEDFYEITVVSELILSSYLQIDSKEFCASLGHNYFCVDSDESTQNFTPCIFSICDYVEEIEGAFYNTDFFEISYDADKLFSLFDLYGSLDQYRSNVYGHKIHRL